MPFLSRPVRFAIQISAALSLMAGAPLAAQQHEAAFSWSGTLADGRRVYIKDVNGSITVTRSRNGRVEVSAEKRWRRGDPSDVRIEQRSIDGDLLICALWQADAACDRGGIRTPKGRWRDRGDVSVHFTVRLPDGIPIDLHTVNGGIEVNDVTAAVTAESVNGSIAARSTGGPVRASTVNGSIAVAMGQVGPADTLEYHTVNGSITLTVPPQVSATVECRTVNGQVVTDLPLTLIGAVGGTGRRQVRGTVGPGAHTALLRAETVNGRIYLRPGT